MSSIGENKVIIFGGADKDGKVLGDTWIYDLKSNTWTELKLSNSPSPRELMNLAVLDSHKVVLFGGRNFDSKTIYEDTWLFDLDSLKWTEMHTKNHPLKMYDYSITSFENGKVCLYGGTDTTKYMFPNDTWVYDYSINNWTMVLFHENYFQNSEIAKIRTGILLKYGGDSLGFNSQRTSIYFTGLKNSWKELSYHGNPIKTYRCSIEQIETNIVLLFGWAGNQDLQNETWIFNILDTSWKKIEIETKPSERYLHRLSKISDRQILLFAGYNAIPIINDTWLFTLDADDVSEQQSPSELKLSPNPTTDFLEITVGAKDIRLEQNIEIFSVLGKTVLNVRAKGPSPQLIDVSSLSPGLYFLKVGEKAGKFVKI